MRGSDGRTLAAATRDEGDWGSRMAAVERLTNLFKLERMVHLTVTVISLVMLLGSAAYLIRKTSADPIALGLMFGCSGLITYSANRLLRMWDQALAALAGRAVGRGGES